MASVRGTDCYVFGNNLEAILEALEEEDDFESDLCDTANKVSISQLNYLIWEQKAGSHINKTQAVYRTQSKLSIATTKEIYFRLSLIT